MSVFLSTFSSCWIWLILGVIIGWVLARLLGKYCCNTKNPKTDAMPATNPANAPNKLVETPAPAKKAAKPAKVAPAKPAPAKAMATATIDIAAAKAAGFTLKNANDLTVIEGIGPKINELFHNNGIQSFAELASATAPQMRTILDAGGSRFRIANPSTWAQQAALAAENKWTELKKLQTALSGGVKK